MKPGNGAQSSVHVQFFAFFQGETHLYQRAGMLVILFRGKIHGSGIV